jgi:hypothetical protein
MGCHSGSVHWSASWCWGRQVRRQRAADAAAAVVVVPQQRRRVLVVQRRLLWVGLERGVLLRCGRKRLVLMQRADKAAVPQAASVVAAAALTPVACFALCCALHC